MSVYFRLREARFERIKPYFALSHGVPRADDPRIVSGTIHMNRNGLRWRDAPEVYGPHKTLYAERPLLGRTQSSASDSERPEAYIPANADLVHARRRKWVRASIMGTRDTVLDTVLKA